MRAIQINSWTPPDQLRVDQMPEPVCGPRDVLIRVQAAPVSHSLALLVQGKYQRKPPFPFVPGNTATGEVVACGAEAGRFKPGDRVLASLELSALAEYAVAPEVNTYAIPDALPFHRAHALNTSYNSVVAALTWPRLLDVQQGQTLLVHGAAGGVGTAAVEIGRIRGATVIATASSEAKRAWASLHGAQHALPSDPATLRDAVMELTQGMGVHAVFDPVGGALFRESLRCMRPEGRILPIGFASGEIPQIPANILMVKNIAVVGLYMGYYKIDARFEQEQRVRAIFAQLGEWFERRLIDPVCTGLFPLERIGEAFAQVLDRNHLGHVAIVMGDEAKRLGLG
jgi:NADPH2:quinone reductase